MRLMPLLLASSLTVHCLAKPAAGVDDGWAAADERTFGQVLRAPHDAYVAAEWEYGHAMARNDPTSALSALAAATNAAWWNSQADQASLGRRLDELDAASAAKDSRLQPALFDLLVARANERTAQKRLQEAEADLDLAARLASVLPGSSRQWAVDMGRALVLLVRGQPEDADARLAAAQNGCPHALGRATLAIWRSNVARRASGQSIEEQQQALHLAESLPELVDVRGYPVLGVMRLGAVAQSANALGDFKRGFEALREYESLRTALVASQGYSHQQTGYIRILNAFRVADMALGERLQQRRVWLAWGLATAGLAVGIVLAILLTEVRRKRRLAELSAKLEQSNRDLQRLSQSRSQLLAVACHDLRQPAHALGMMAELALAQASAPNSDGESTSMRQRLAGIRSCSFTLADMLSELMDLTRLDDGRYVPTMRRVALHELFHDVQVQFAELAHRKSLTLSIQNTHLDVRSDARLLRRVVFNLVSNAVKYTDRGGITLAAQSADDLIEIVLTDTGRGIPAEAIGRMFDDYVRHDRTSSVEGLGIGLSIVKRACVLLGHTLEIESDINRGTRVTLRIAGSTEAVVSREFNSNPGDVGSGQLVLLLENDLDSRRALTDLLQRWGFDVLEGGRASDLSDALSAMSPRTPSLLVTDLHLDGTDGIQQLKLIRSWRDCADLPALIVTGDLDPQVSLHAAALHAVLTHKPLQPRALREQIETIIRRRHHGAAAAVESP